MAGGHTPPHSYEEKMIRLSSIGVCFILIVAATSGCGDKIDPLSAPPGGGNGGGDDGPTYVQDIRSILDQNCLPCHSTSKAGSQRNGAPPTINFETYELAVANIERANARIQAGTMPPTSGLEPENRTTVLDWLAAGIPRGEP